LKQMQPNLWFDAIDILTCLRRQPWAHLHDCRQGLRPRT